MCVIVIIRKRDEELYNELESCAKANGDGNSMAWFENGQVCYKKDMTITEIKEKVKTENLPVICHMRIATVGPTKKLLHPFEITKTSELHMEQKTNNSVLFHNGHWEDYKLWIREFIITGTFNNIKGEISDSRIMAMMFSLVKKGQYETLASLIGTNKVVVMRKGGEIYKYGDFKDKRGNLFSNLHWEMSNTGFQVYERSSSLWPDDYDTKKRKEDIEIREKYKNWHRK